MAEIMRSRDPVTTTTFSRSSPVSRHAIPQWNAPAVDDGPDWVYRTFFPCEDKPGAPQPDLMGETSVLLIEQCGQDVGQISFDGHSLNQALQKSGYPLHGVKCHCDENQTLNLSGRVTTYFYKQMALEIVRPLAKGRRIDVQIDVVPATAAVGLFPH